MWPFASPELGLLDVALHVSLLSDSAVSEGDHSLQLAVLALDGAHKQPVSMIHQNQTLNNTPRTRQSRT